MIRVLHCLPLCLGITASIIVCGCQKLTTKHSSSGNSHIKNPAPALGKVFRYFKNQHLGGDEKYPVSLYDVLVIDPAWVNISLSKGWEQEYQASKDETALAFFSGPTFELANTELGAVPQGDLKTASGFFPSGNKAAAKQRAYVAITKDGRLDFGYGELNLKNLNYYKIFIGGLHAFANNIIATPPSYKGVYKEITQSDIRLVYGLRQDGMLELIETRDGMPKDQLAKLVSARRLLAAYLPDHASKSRLIIPRVRTWSSAHADWITGGRPNITAMPYLLRITIDPRVRK